MIRVRSCSLAAALASALLLSAGGARAAIGDRDAGPRAPLAQTPRQAGERLAQQQERETRPPPPAPTAQQPKETRPPPPPDLQMQQPKEDRPPPPDEEKR